MKWKIVEDNTYNIIKWPYQNENIEFNKGINNPNDTVQKVGKRERERHVLHTFGLDHLTLFHLKQNVVFVLIKCKIKYKIFRKEEVG